MFEYTYPYKGGDQAVMALKIERKLGVPAPGSSSDLDKVVTFEFPDELTETQKADLDALMEDDTLGIIPLVSGSTVEIKDIMDLRSGARTYLNLDFDIYPTSTGYQVVFNKTLSEEDIANIKAAWITLLTFK